MADPTTLSADAVLLALQAPTGNPRSSFLEAATDPVSPPTNTEDLFSHFHPDLYDLSPESHLSRFLKIFVGDSGLGSLRKQYFVERLGSTLSGTRYGDLDRLYGTLFSIPRYVRETLPISPYGLATPNVWQEMDCRDASYRSRIEQFSKAIALAGTPDGVRLAAQAILGGVPVRVYETYQFMDLQLPNPNGGVTTSGANTYGNLEFFYGTYGAMEHGTYADLEGGVVAGGRLANNRSEIVVRPRRSLSTEEAYHLTKVLGRIKPAQALLTITTTGQETTDSIGIHSLYADSVLWEISRTVAPLTGTEEVYGFSTPQEPPRPAFSGYQGEAWSYNTDVASVLSYTETPDGTLLANYNYQRVVNDQGQTNDYSAPLAVADPVRLLLGRAASDGVLVASPYVRGGAT